MSEKSSTFAAEMAKMHYIVLFLDGYSSNAGNEFYSKVFITQ